MSYETKVALGVNRYNKAREKEEAWIATRLVMIHQ